MRCAACGQDNAPSAKFCAECGARLAERCPTCGAEVKPTAKFCDQCGARLREEVPRHAAPGDLTAPVTQRFASPETYTPVHLAEKILTSRSALEGERKQVTVLFADLKGSMELLADRDPEEARKILDPVLEGMMAAVHRYEGTVNQVMGDGIMALFGAPVAHEDHAVRASYAALRMQESIKRYAAEVQRTRGIPVHIRVGLNTGEVVVRSIGSDLHMDYTAVGQTTHLAARMEQTAMPGTILITAETLRLAEGYVEVRSVGPVTVKGLSEPVEVYELTGAGSARTRLQAAAARALTRFVGRDTEVGVLSQALDRARGGHGQVVAVVGEPGVGKSRLFWEFARSHRTQGWLVLESSSVSYGKATPYLPVVDLLKAYFQIEAGDEPRKIREKVIGKLLTLDQALQPTLPAFLTLLDVPAEDPQWQALDPHQRRERTLDAVKRLVLREGQVQPVCLVFEDLHWIDSETQAFLDSLVESLPTARILLLVNYRPEYQHGWGSKTYYTQIRIDPLPPESAEELLRGLLGDDPALEPLKRLLIERTEGNPFFLEESVRTLVETQVLVGERGRYSIAKALQTIQVPATVQAVLAARTDRLPPEEKRLLQTASVIGKDIPYALLQAIAGAPEDTLRKGLAHLQAAEFIYEASLFPEPVYMFRHALTHDVAYASMLQSQRRRLHARIGALMEGLYPERLEERLGELAHHFVQGEEWEKAVDYLGRAGAKAVARCVDREAVAFYERALEALEHLAASGERDGRAIDLRLEMRAPLWRLGKLDRLFGLFRDAEQLAESLEDPRRLEKIYAFLVQYYWAMAEYPRAIEYGERCLTAGETLDDLTLRVTGNLYLGHAYHCRGEYRRAVEYLDRNVELLEGEKAFERFGLSGLPYVVSCSWAVFALAELGEFDRGLEYARRGGRVAEAADHPYSLTSIRLFEGLLRVRRGEPEMAIPLLEPTLEICRSKNFAGSTMRAATALGIAYAHAGRVAEAIPLHQEAIQLQEAAGAFTDRSYWWANLAEAHLLAGRAEEARQAGEEALKFATAHGERGREAWAKWLLGTCTARPDLLQEAFQIAEALGMRPLLARCLVSLGELHLKAGRAVEARAPLTRAVELFRAMGMGRDLARAEALLSSR
ncbi:MAG: AAA family ATPase [Candidatus Rokubacteria bacterium]|nr:AAA family ATPase [Candidatus Rokubacteria bacterium]